MAPKRSVLTLTLFSLFAASAQADDWKANYPVPEGKFKSAGSGAYFVLEPGFTLEYGSKKAKHLVITVLNETKVVDGVETRIVEEKESEDGQLVEISRNYFAISEKTGDLCYFGEDVDMYKDGKVTDHGGSWLSGEKGAHYGVLLPGKLKVGQRYYQEQAPEVAMDRAEVMSTQARLKTPSGDYKGCALTDETTPLEKGISKKAYAPGIGLIKDGDLLLSKVTRSGDQKK